MGTPTMLHSLPRTVRACAQRRFSRVDYHAMGDAGILAPDERVELMEGEVVVMSPIGSRHAAGVLQLIRAFTSGSLAGRALVQVQNPLAASDRSEPQPDLMLLIPRDDSYASGHPGPEDVFLLVEVADSSLKYDRRAKIPFYAGCRRPRSLAGRSGTRLAGGVYRSRPEWLPHHAALRARRISGAVGAPRPPRGSGRDHPRISLN